MSLRDAIGVLPIPPAVIVLQLAIIRDRYDFGAGPRPGERAGCPGMADRQLAVVRTYAELMDAVRARIAELGLSRDQIDELLLLGDERQPHWRASWGDCGPRADV